MDHQTEDVTLWNLKAEEWHSQVGVDGDINRRLNSDPVLWRMSGEVRGLDVLDAGSGTGYLTIQLAQKGAHVRGVDYSPAMVNQARGNAESAGFQIPFNIDCVSTLATVSDRSMDLIISNYVLMDCRDMEEAISSFWRVLRPKGRAVLIFSHPCFDVPPTEHPESGPVYHWRESYFEERREISSWGNFSSPFSFYHRPLGQYFKAFQTSGFVLIAFEEPVIQPPYPENLSEERLHRLQTRPFSVAVHLVKSN